MLYLKLRRAAGEVVFQGENLDVELKVKDPLAGYVQVPLYVHIPLYVQIPLCQDTKCGRIHFPSPPA